MEEKKEFLEPFEYDGWTFVSSAIDPAEDRESKYDVWKVHAIDPDGDIRRDVYEVMWDAEDSVCIIEPGTGCWAIASVRGNRGERLFEWEFQEEYIKALRLFLESEEE